MKCVRMSLAVFVAALVVAGSAFAGGSTLQSGYSSTPHNVAGGIAPSHSSAVTGTTVKVKGSLPFTGANLAWVAAAAVALGGTGFAFRRLGRQRG